MITDERVKAGQIIQELSSLLNLEDDWNVFGAVKPLSAAIEQAKSFIKLIPMFKLPNIIYPDGEGNIVFVWEFAGLKILLNIESIMLHYLYEDEVSIIKTAENIPFDGENIPQEILNILPRLT